MWLDSSAPVAAPLGAWSAERLVHRSETALELGLWLDSSAPVQRHSARGRPSGFSFVSGNRSEVPNSRILLLLSQRHSARDRPSGFRSFPEPALKFSNCQILLLLLQRSALTGRNTNQALGNHSDEKA